MHLERLTFCNDVKGEPLISELSSRYVYHQLNVLQTQMVCVSSREL